MDTTTISTSVGAWVAIIVGVLGLVLSVAGAYHAWRERRLARAKRLADTAAMAVRRVEATYVRPILQERLEAAVGAWQQEMQRAGSTVVVVGGEGGMAGCVEGPSMTVTPDARGAWWRMRLFCRLQREVRLNAAEKTEAQRRGVEGLLTALRGMPSPPLRVNTDRRVQSAAGALAEQIEGAFQLRPRASTTLIGEFNAFCPPSTGPMPMGGGGPPWWRSSEPTNDFNPPEDNQPRRYRQAI